jgi:hypothetical protein
VYRRRQTRRRSSNFGIEGCIQQQEANVGKKGRHLKDDEYDDEVHTKWG